MKIEYDNETIEFTVEYRKRKTLEIKIDLAGMINVIVPNGTSEKVIMDSVGSKGRWILKKLEERREKYQSIKEKNYENEELFLYLGTEYPIQIITDESIKKTVVVFENNTFFITTATHEKESLKSAMEKFYRKKCRQKIQQRVAYYQKNFKIKPKMMEVTESKNIWGSCSSDRNMKFNWKLIMAPIEIIDYIVVHEMCHLHHMNHSKSFWTLVGKIMPDYKERSEWLKYNSGRMKI